VTQIPHPTARDPLTVQMTFQDAHNSLASTSPPTFSKPHSCRLSPCRVTISRTYWTWSQFIPLRTVLIQVTTWFFVVWL